MPGSVPGVGRTGDERQALGVYMSVFSMKKKRNKIIADDV